jgi:hypothetical protein
MKHRKLTSTDFLNFNGDAGEDFCDQIEYIGIPLEFSEKIKEKYPKYKFLIEKIDEKAINASNSKYGDLSNIQMYQKVYRKMFPNDHENKAFYKDYCDLCVNLSQERIDAVWKEFSNWDFDPNNPE